ncbi:MAG: cupin domain-containing protein [Candidatus Woesearchaeota archaeon]
MIDVYSLKPADNICDQVLREVIAIKDVNMAHVIMDSGNTSLLHQHKKFTEIYFILEGEGILYYDDKALKVKEESFLLLPPKTPHKLENTGKSGLEHLVLSTPGFDPGDIEMVEDSSYKSLEEFKHNIQPKAASDGAIVYELVSGTVGLALGVLPKNRIATSHYHKITEEIYYVISGKGKAKVGDKAYDVKKGSVVHLPTNTLHSLESEEELKILCISSPSYTHSDFLTE